MQTSASQKIAAALQTLPSRLPTPSRRTQAQRSAETRTKLMEAAIRCLHRSGYSATTTTLVAKKAGVSRGGMLHQFRTKVDLMVAVVEHVLHEQQEMSYRLLGAMPPGPERFAAITDVGWKVQSEIPSLALLEILVAARSQPSLLARLEPLIDRMHRDTFEFVWQEAQQVGITDRDAVANIVRLHLAAMRGLSLELIYGRPSDRCDPPMALLKTYKAMMTPRLLQQVDAD